MTKLAINLGVQLDEPSQYAFATKENTKEIGDQLNLFEGKALRIGLLQCVFHSGAFTV